MAVDASVRAIIREGGGMELAIEGAFWEFLGLAEGAARADDGS